MKTITVNLFEGCKKEHEEIIRFLVEKFGYSPWGFVAYQKEDLIYYFGRLIWTKNSVMYPPRIIKDKEVTTIDVLDEDGTEKDIVTLETQERKRFTRAEKDKAYNDLVKRKLKVCKECGNVAKHGLRKGWCLTCYRHNTGRSMPKEYPEARAFNFVISNNGWKISQNRKERIMAASNVLDSVKLSDEDAFEQELIDKLGYELWERVKVLFGGK